MTNPILDAWLTVIARDGWQGARIDAVAVVAGTTTAAVAERLPDRWAALDVFGRVLDVAALADAGADRDGSVRDRLFAVLMARFDAAQDQRAAVEVLAAAARSDPGLAAFFALRLPRSIARLADAAGVATGGVAGPLRVQVLTAIDLAVTRVWLADTSDDLSATMKELDTRLAQAEGWARRMPYRPAPPPMLSVTPALPPPATIR